MDDTQKEVAALPGWTAIHDHAELEALDPFDPAWLLIPAPLVRPIFLWLEMLYRLDDLGVLSRGIEGLLVALVEPDTRGMVSCTRQIGSSLGRLIRTAQERIPN